MAGIRLFVLVLALLVCSSALAQEATAADLKLAFLGDQGLKAESRAVLKLIKAEGAHAVVHQGDFDYKRNPPAWDRMIDEILGEEFPYFASVGNHDAGVFYGKGGYQEHLVAPAGAVARMPEGLPFAEAAPLMCAGVTTFNSLRNSGARSGDLVAVQGLGGLGHLGVQFARAMGFQVVAVSRGSDKEPFARELGAHHYVDSNREDAAQQIADLGGARVLLATAPHAPTISKMIPALGIGGCLMLVAAPFEPLQVGAIDMISRGARIQGWASGTAMDATETMAFAALHGVKPMVET